MFEKIFARTALLTMIAAGALLGYWQFIDGTGPLITVQSSQTNKTVYRQGEVMVVTRIMCINMAGPYTLTRSFVDHLVYQITDYPTTPPESGCRPRTVGIEIPPALPPGHYIYRVGARIPVNPIKTVRFEYPDISIEVVAAEPKRIVP